MGSCKLLVWLVCLAVHSVLGGGSADKDKWLFQGHGAVTELRSAAEVEAALGHYRRDDKDGPSSIPGISPRLAVFYAHWCSHCQAYAPRYKALAMTHLASVNKVSALVRGGDPRAPPVSVAVEADIVAANVSFVAVNCVVLEDVCRKYKVKGYPTVLAFGFRNESESFTALGAPVQAHSATEYLDKQMPHRLRSAFAAIRSSDVAGAGGDEDALVVQLQEEAGKDASFEAWLAATSGLSLVDEGYSAKAQHKDAVDTSALTKGRSIGGARALSAAPADRVLDALESVYLLLLQEIGEDKQGAPDSAAAAATSTADTADLSPDDPRSPGASRQTLRMLCDTLALYLPQQMPEKQVFRRLATELAPGGRLALNQTAAASSSSDTTISASSSASAQARSVLHSIISRRRIDGLRWHVCGVTATAATATAGWDTHAYVAAMRGSRVLASGAARGFNCGLWMLFHFITVAANQTRPPSIGVGGATYPHHYYSTQHAMGLIRRIVASLFRCDECRAHFLAAFDACLFGRCGADLAPHLLQQRPEGHRNYAALQRWIWNFHNNATNRIMRYRFFHGQDPGAMVVRPASTSSGGGSTTSYTSASITQRIYPDVLWPSSAVCPDCRTAGQTQVAYIEGDNAGHTHSVLRATTSSASSIGSSSVSSSASAMQVNLTSRRIAKRLPCTFRADAEVLWDDAAVVSYINSAYWDGSGQWARHPHRAVLAASAARFGTAADEDTENGDLPMRQQGLIARLIATVGPYFMYLVAFRMLMVVTVMATCCSAADDDSSAMGASGGDSEDEDGADVAGGRAAKHTITSRLARAVRAAPSTCRRNILGIVVRILVRCCPLAKHGTSSTSVGTRGGSSGSSSSNAHSSSSKGSGGEGTGYGGGSGFLTPKRSHPKDVV